MSIKQSVSRQSHLDEFRKIIESYLRNCKYIFVDDYPKWSVYYGEEDEPADGSWSHDAFENAIAYKILKEGILS